MTTTIQIKPDRFIASGGKLDSNFRYLRRSASPSFYLSMGKQWTYLVEALDIFLHQAQSPYKMAHIMAASLAVVAQE